MSKEQVRRRAAQYVRMSSDQQDYSVTYQKKAIADFAEKNGFEVVATYADEGVSGLGIERREGLKALLADVFAGHQAFEAILVYDVSRWGRFQNPDQAAHYEFMCQEAGARVIYCAETFQDDGSPLGALIKHIKRTMAAEYSRELSVKVRRAKNGLRSLGFWQGSTPGYGLRREIVSVDGRALAIRDHGEWKGFPNAHTRLTKGPEGEIAVIKRIYEMFLAPEGSYRGIAETLNREGILGEGGEPWTRARVRNVLVNPKYKGELTVGRYRVHLGGQHTNVPSEDWVVVPGGSPTIVDSRTFAAAQRKRCKLRRSPSRDEALDELRRLLKEHGRLSLRIVIDHGRWSPTVYTRRFGGIGNAFAEVGYQMSPVHQKLTEKLRRGVGEFDADPTAFKIEMIEALKKVLAEHGRLTRRIVDGSPIAPSAATYARWFGSLAAAYELAGYRPTGSQKTLMQMHGEREGSGWVKPEVRRAPTAASSRLLAKMRQ